MSFFILFKDELRGFYKSKVMLVLWVGLPFLAILISLLDPGTEGIPLLLFIGLMAMSLSGTLSSVMLSTTIVNEKNNHVYDLFLIRPIKRSHLILAKLAAVYLCLTLALFISLGCGVIIDAIRNELPAKEVIVFALEATAMGMASMAIACTSGILIGLLVDNVMVAAILSIYVGNQLATLVVLPGIFIEAINPIIFSGLVGIGISSLLIVIIIKVFQKKQL